MKPYRIMSLSPKTNNGEEGYDWSAYSEEVQHNSVNQALMANIKGKESSEKVSPTKSDCDDIAFYRHHNQILVDELNKALEINQDLKAPEKVFNEKIEALTNDLAAMTDIKNVLEIQQADLLHKVNINHLPSVPLSEDPILSS
ncbi:hypothetical protein L1987_13589 [Smallanthus sonchifolius]|uniref:Uncharacterized protein n=1 Tax=Smallanthus sonchifolius TaxID=185202 RepID=A0ACB9JHV1_9ASTR|nr:hypothetical protein L1987_13589 [Smallanthus sonchifolius]